MRFAATRIADGIFFHHHPTLERDVRLSLMGEHEREKKSGAGTGRQASSDKESSVLFSLRELMSIEAERTAEERQREADTIESDRRAKMEAELRLRAAEEARMRENDARRAAEQAAMREETARHEAMRLAAVERARIEAEQSARLAKMELERKHERELAVIHTDEDKLRYKRVALLGTGVFALALASVVGFYFGVHKPKIDAEQEQMQRDIIAAQASADAAKQQAEAKEATIDRLEKDLAKEKDEHKRIEIQNQLDVLHGKPLPAPPPTVRPPPHPTAHPTSAPCDTHDPLDPCLKASGSG